MSSLIKRLFFTLLAIGISASASAVTPISITDTDGDRAEIVSTPDVSEIIPSRIFEIDTSIPSQWQSVADCKRVLFIINYTENNGTDVAMNISINASSVADISGNNVGFPISFYDEAGGATLQTKQAFTANTTYICWLPPEITVPFVRIEMSPNNCNVTDFPTLEAKIIKYR